MTESTANHGSSSRQWWPAVPKAPSSVAVASALNPQGDMVPACLLPPSMQPGHGSSPRQTDQQQADQNNWENTAALGRAAADDSALEDPELRWTQTTIMVDIRPTTFPAALPLPIQNESFALEVQRQPHSSGEGAAGLGWEAPAPKPPAAAVLLPAGRGPALDTTQPLLYAAVFLTEVSRNLLLQLVPPLHALVQADHLIVKYEPRQQDLMALPVGAEVALQVVGAAADNMSQVVLVYPPAWLSCPDSHGPHISVSASPEANRDHGGILMMEGLAGLNTSYSPLLQPFLVYGRLGLASSSGQVMYSAQELLLALGNSGPGHQEAAGQLQGAAGHLTSAGDAAAGPLPLPIRSALPAAAIGSIAGVAAASPLPLPVRAPPPPAAPAPTAVTPTRQQQQPLQPAAAAATATAASPIAAGPGDFPSLPSWKSRTPPAAAPATAAKAKAGGGSGAAAAAKLSLKDFMLSEHTGRAPGAAPAAPWGAAPGLSGARRRAGPREGASSDDLEAAGVGAGVSGRLCWLGDLGLGDYVEVAPMLGQAQARGSSDGSGGFGTRGSSCDGAGDLVEGFVEEILMEEEYQPKGVLVRLHENTLGYAVRLVAKQGPAAAAAAAAHARRLREQQEGGGGGLFPGQGRGQAKAEGGSPEAAGEEEAGEQYTSEATSSAWEQYREQYGEALTSAVLEDCRGDVERAVSTLDVQASLLGTESLQALDLMVARAISQAQVAAVHSLAAEQQEDEARRAAKQAARSAAAAAAAASQQQQQQQRPAAAAAAYQLMQHPAPAAGAGAGGPAVPGPAASKAQWVYESTADDELEPVSGRGAAGGRHKALGWGAAPLRRQPGPSDRPAGDKPAAAAPAPAPAIKLLHRPDSLATAAAQAGVNIRSAEALKVLLPGYSSRAVVEALGRAGGDVNSAADLLLASGPPTETEVAAAAVAAVVSMWDDSSSSSDEEEEEGKQERRAAAAAGHGPGPGVSGLDAARPRTTTSQKVSQLVQSFEGLDRSLAEFLLKQCQGDVERTSRYILEEVLGRPAAAQAEAAAPVPEEKQVVPAPEPAPQPFTPQPAYKQAAASGGDAHFNSHTRPAAVARPTRPVMLPGRLPAALPAAPSAAAATGPAQPAAAGSSSRSWETVSRSAAKQRPRRPQYVVGGDVPEPDAAKANHRLEADQARRIAQVYYDARTVFFRRAAAAYSSGDGRLASEFSRRGREMSKLAHQHRDAANEAAYRASNTSIRNQYVMDLHFMFVEEAMGMLRHTLGTLEALDSPKGLTLKVITGIGHHSANNIPVIKRAVLAYLKERGLRHFIDPTNEGVVCVQLGG